jgi:catechol 2,3-dioxygenase-like lactoylglutathione lyase family enzyme
MILESVIFYTQHFQETLEFYTQVLGLEVVYLREGEFVSFQLQNGPKLGLKFAVEGREIPGAQNMIVGVQDINAEFEKLKRQDVEFYKELKEESWGWEFSILDLDGNKIIYHQVEGV